MSTSDTTKGPRVHRPAASATWEFEHRWAPGFSDTITLRVTRTDDGPLRITYGRDSFEIRGELVAVAAEMIAAAAAWSDEGGAS